tara:strand:+ start:752 stop:985 length:234 start_codon:yes stop_codon:yes gene_type:complete
MKKIKLIWDFWGAYSKNTASHHEIHLKEFFKYEKKKLINSGIEKINDSHYAAFTIIEKKDLDEIKLILKPRRAEIID